MSSGPRSRMSTSQSAETLRGIPYPRPDKLTIRGLMGGPGRGLFDVGRPEGVVKGSVLKFMGSH